MDELFRLRIAAKRQVTIPQRLMDLLALSVDDELWVEVNGNDVRLVPMVQVPRSMVTPEFLKMLDVREQESKLHPLPEVADASTLSAQVKSMVTAPDLGRGHARPSFGTIKDHGSPVRDGLEIKEHGSSGIAAAPNAIKDHGLAGGATPMAIKDRGADACIQKGESADQQMDERYFDTVG